MLHKVSEKLAYLLKTKYFQSVLTLAIFSSLAYFSYLSWDYISDGWDILITARKKPIILAVISATLALVAQSELMTILTRAAGVDTKRRNAYLTGAAANAWSSSLPGGNAISVVIVFREQKKWGASSSISSWYLLLSGVISTASISLLAIFSVLFLGMQTDNYRLTITLLVSAVAVTFFGLSAKKIPLKNIISHPKVEKSLKPLHMDASHLVSKLSNYLLQITQVKVKKRVLFYALFLSILNWVLEISCLFFCAIAVSNSFNSGIVIAFIASKIAGQVQVTPGGLGTVDIVLTSALISFGNFLTSEAIAISVLFRLITLFFLAALGWACFFYMKFSAKASPETQQANSMFYN